MRILVTGGAGFIGSHVLECALERGHEVAALDDLSSGRRANLPAGVHLYEVDIRDADSTRAAVLDFRPDGVSHQAAQASVSVSMREPALDAAVNVVGGLHVLGAARDAGAERFVFASTGGAIYGNIPDGSAKEDAPQLPISPYAIDKLAFEMLMAQVAGDLKTTTLRYANVYGPRQDPHGEAGVVAIFLERALRGSELRVNAMREPGDEGCIRDYVYVTDVAAANLQALEGALSAPVLNLGTGVPTTTRTLAQTVLQLVPDSTSPLTSGPPRAGDVERSVLDGGRYLESLGGPVRYVDLAEGMASTAEWYRATARAPA